MVNLVTQYNVFNNKDRLYTVSGWDGASGPYLFHIIKNGNMSSSLAPYVKVEGYEVEIAEWEGNHLNKFRLELIYE